MQISEQRGFGISVPFEQLTADKLKKAVDKMLENPKFVDAINRYEREIVFNFILVMHIKQT